MKVERMISVSLINFRCLDNKAQSLFIEKKLDKKPPEKYIQFGKKGL